MGIPSRISHFSSVTSLLLAGLSCAALVAACSSDDASDTSSNTSTGTSSTTDAGTSSDAGNSVSDAGPDADITTVSGDSGAHSYTVSVTVTGLSGTGLILQNNGGDDLAVTADGTVPFATALADGTLYTVSVSGSPTNPSQDCIVNPQTASGAITGANVTNIAVTCTTKTFKVGGTISGLVGTGLVLTNNAGDDLTVDPLAPPTFTFATPVASGAAYDVEVKTQPDSAQSCAVTTKTNTGNVGAADVSTVAITCSTMVCATASENATATLTCPAGQTIASVEFASYGSPTGTCGAFVAGDTCQIDVAAAVLAMCTGLGSCDVGATNANFTDPCQGIGKSLDLQATCK